MSDLQPDWTFERSTPALSVTFRRLMSIPKLRRRPASATIVQVAKSPRWILYFVYLPNGELTDGHRYSLDRLAAENANLAVVCATPRLDDVPTELRDRVDALFWKALSGFDFSAYAIGLRAIALHSSGSDVFVMNDSVLGPFSRLEPYWDNIRWDLTGMTASAQIENHIQSYAFIVRGLDRARYKALGISGRVAFNDFRSVLMWQETRLARLAARTMSVGAYWYSDDVTSGDPSIRAAESLVQNGFPLLKRSLFGKHDLNVDSSALRGILRQFNHPEV